MSIRTPSAKYTDTERRIINIIAELLLRTLSHKHGNNFPKDHSRISDKQAAELIIHINRIVETRDFAEKMYFCSSISAATLRNIKDLKEIFLSGIKRSGRSRAMSGMRWAEFVDRFSLQNGAENARAMAFSQFLNMERKLLRDLKIHPIVVEYIIRLSNGNEDEIQKHRHINSNRSKINIGKPLNDLVDSLETSRRSPDVAIPNKQLSAVMTIVMNAGVIFTTRDWSLAGTLSCMSGAIGDLTPYDHASEFDRSQLIAKANRRTQCTASRPTYPTNYSALSGSAPCA